MGLVSTGLERLCLDQLCTVERFVTTLFCTKMFVRMLGMVCVVAGMTRYIKLG